MSNPFNNNPVTDDCIELGLPLNPAYVSAARLTASSVANRLGFNIEEIEDIKAAVAEACNFLIKNNSGSQNTFNIKFEIKNKSLTVELSSLNNTKKSSDDDSELGILMIEALMDEINIDNSKKKLVITMIKYIR